jgi:epoxyqueuosine reductase
MDMGIDVEIRELAESLGADFYGVADLAPAREAIAAQGGDLVVGYPRSVSVGVKLMHSLVDLLPGHAEDRLVGMNYRHHAYDVVNLRLDQLTGRLASALQGVGHRVLPVPASQTVSEEKLCAIFSHKMGAHLAGLGWIGKNCLLITPEAGPRVRWATVLTDAPLAATGRAMEERCGSCSECVDTCPVRAITGEPFRETDARDVRLDARSCRVYQEEMKEKVGFPVCGMCLYSCPHGQM